MNEENQEKEPAKKKRKGLKIFFVVLLLSLLLVGFVVARDSSYHDETEPVPPAPDDLAKGTIEGSLGYPSDFIPPLEICAESTNEKESFCTYEMIRGEDYLYGFGFQLRVPAGKYYVYAKLSDQEKYEDGIDADYRAYYSEFVTCGMDFECPSHRPIVVKVSADETTAEVDPLDWYRDLENEEGDEGDED